MEKRIHSHGVGWRSRLPIPGRSLRIAVAHEREIAETDWRARSVAVIPVTPSAPTSIVSASLSLVATAALVHPIVAVDLGHQRSLSWLLGSRGDSDLATLGRSERGPIPTTEISSMVDHDTASGVAVCGFAKSATTARANARSLKVSTDRLKRAFRGLVIDFPHDAEPSWTTAVLTQSSVVIAVTENGVLPPWLVDQRSPLLGHLDSGRLIVVDTDGAPAMGHTELGTRSIPTIGLGLRRTVDARLVLPVSRRGLDLAACDDGLAATIARLGQFAFGADAPRPI